MDFVLEYSCVTLTFASQLSYPLIGLNQEKTDPEIAIVKYLLIKSYFKFWSYLNIQIFTKILQIPGTCLIGLVGVCGDDVCDREELVGVRGDVDVVCCDREELSTLQ